MESDTPRTDDEFSDAIKHFDLIAELAEMKKKLAEARGLYLQRNYHREQLERELAAAIKQRDEARRMICEDESYNHKSGVTPREVAEDRGWDCFAQREGGGA